jgi:hypothetical protein
MKRFWSDRHIFKKASRRLAEILLALKNKIEKAPVSSATTIL